MNCRICGAALPPDALFCGECGSATSATPRSRLRPEPAPGDTSVIDPLRPASELEQTTPRSEVRRPDSPAEASHLLVFSTGEHYTVTGTGLIGRRPLPEPAEYVDALLQIDDRSRSVSKTHLEYGSQEQELWILDRFSSNGTLIRRPDGSAIRCQPGRRYLVPSGSRVDIGDVRFTVD